MIKKITLLLGICITSLVNAQSINVTGMKEPGAASFMTVDDFIASRTLEGVTGRVEVGESIVCQVVHTNLPAAPDSSDARLVLRYAKDEGSSAVGYSFLNVTALAAETTDEVTWEVGDNAPGNNPEPAVFQAFAAGDFATNYTKSGFNVVPAGTLSVNTVENISLQAFYSSGKDAIVMKDNSLSGSFSIYNLMGQEVLSGEISNEISTESLKAGMYIFAIAQGTVKFVK